MTAADKAVLPISSIARSVPVIMVAISFNRTCYRCILQHSWTVSTANSLLQTSLIRWGSRSVRGGKKGRGGSFYVAKT